MTTSTLRCACGNTVDYQNTMVGAYAPQHVIKMTGWRYVFLADGNTIWLCPTCISVAAKAAQTLIELLGTGLVQLNHIGELE